MRELRVNVLFDPVMLDVLFVLQLHTGDEPLLPRLESLECQTVTETFMPFIPLFLSPKTVKISIGFGVNASTIIVASMITRFSELCPNIQHLVLDGLPSNRVIIEAVSEMLLACNRDALRSFDVDYPLTEEARRFLHTLPKLRKLWVFTQGPTLLPPLALPDLEELYIDWDCGRDWIQGFCGATIGKLKAITFQSLSGSTQIGGFLEEFKTVALATSLQNTLSEFEFRTSQSWNPNYSSLLVFNQMRILDIEFSCDNGCSSTVDDDTVTNLARAMPKLKILRLGKAPCSALTGVTLRGLVALAGHCPQLSELCIHVQARELGETITGVEPPRPSGNPAVIPQADCALTNLRVGEAPIPQEVASAVALALLEVFPRILEVYHVDPRWKSVVEMIKLFRRIRGHVDHTSKAHLMYLECLLVMPY